MAKSGNTELAKQSMKDYFNSGNKVMGDSWEETLLDGIRRVCEPVAQRMLNQIGLNEQTTEPFALFDNACGPGPVAAELQRLIRPDVLQNSSILCGDFSVNLVDLVQRRAQREGWVNIEARQIDGQDNKLPSASFTHVTTNMGFHVIPDSSSALDEAIRVVKPGGFLAFSSIHIAPGWAADLQKAFASFPFEAPFDMPLQTTEWGDWSDVNWVRKTLAGRGLEDVKVHVFAFLARVESVAHYMSSFGPMIDFVMKNSWSEEVRNAHGKDEVHGLIRQFLEDRYGGQGWDTTWTSLVASGRVPLSRG